MSILRERGTAYLAMRRSLGYKLRGHGYLLMEFIGYLEDHGHSTVTTDAAMSWATAPADTTRTYWNRRLSVARCFARYLSAFDLACQIPPAGPIGPSEARPAPYLYSPEEIAALIHAAGTLASPLQAATCQALISLLAVTGMRVGEAVALDAGDVDLDAALVTVHGKYDRTRLVPLHPTTVTMLRRYRRRCRQLCPAPSTPAFFLSPAGTRLAVSRVDAVFAQLLARTGINGRRGRPAHVHDLRHSFAVTSLTDWYRAGADVAARMPLLSAFMGHAGPASTFYYLHAAPELPGLAAQRLCDHQQQHARREEP
jgi:integrase/recombinase XerD